MVAPTPNFDEIKKFQNLKDSQEPKVDAGNSMSLFVVFTSIVSLFFCHFLSFYKRIFWKQIALVDSLGRIGASSWNWHQEEKSLDGG